MSKGDNSPGLSRFAGIMKALAKGQVPTDLLLDFGEIQKNGSLLTNTVTVEIPKNDYLVLKEASVKKGDHVLVAWVQNDAVVLGRIQKASDAL